MRNDRRTRYTENVMKEAFLSALSHKPLNKITVKEICEAADINRGTFYLHYMDIQDLFRKLEIEYAQIIISNLKEFRGVFENGFEESMTKLLLFLQEHQEISTVLFHPDASGTGVKMILETEKERWISVLNQYKSLSEMELLWISEFYFHGFIALIYDWHNSGYQWNIHELIHAMNQLASHGLYGII